MMSYSRRSRYSRFPSPYRRYSSSASRSLSRSRSRSRSRYSSDVENPGNNLYVTGLSARITKKELEKHFSSEGKVVNIHLVVDPWTRESRGFGFVTMSNLEEAERCIKYLDHSVLEGRVITVEKARRRRGRTPTPGKYLGIRTIHVCRRSPSYSPYYRSRHGSPHSSESEGNRSNSPYVSRYRSVSRSPTPYNRSPVGRRDRSYFPCHYSTRVRSVSPYHRRRRRYRSISRSVSPRGRSSYSRSLYPRSRRSSRSCCSRSISPKRRRSYSRSISPRWRRRYSRSVSPTRKSSRRNYSCSVSPRPRSSRRRSLSYSASSSSLGSYSRDSYSRSRSVSSRSRSVSRS